MSIVGYVGSPAYDTFLIVSLSSQPVYEPNPLRPNPNPKKPMLGSCRVRRLGQTLTPLDTRLTYGIYWFLLITNITFKITNNYLTH